MMPTFGRASPTGFARRRIEHGLPARLFVQQAATELDTGPCPRSAALVHETLDGEAIERMAHRAPVADIDADLVLQIVDVHVRHAVGIVVCGFDRERIDDVLRRPPAPTAP